MTTPTDDVNLLNEVCDDPDDADSDYGRGFAAGRRQAAVEVAAIVAAGLRISKAVTER